jgi:N-methylhydantoinase B
VVGPDRVERELNSKATVTIPPEAEVWLRAPGAGGFGPPGERDPERLRDDVINGYVSRDAATGDYGYRDRSLLTCPACAKGR